MIAIAALSFGAALRFIGLGAPFESSDQATMAHAVRYNFGIDWILGHQYGPVIAIIYAAYARFMSWMGIGLTEFVHRLPVALVGWLQILITYPLMRRLHRTQIEAALAMLIVAALPTLVTDARLTWAWGYLTVWLFSGSVALWLTFAYLDDRRRWQLAGAVAALIIHCLSNAYSFALPLTLGSIWAVHVWHAFRNRQHSNRKQLLIASLAGYIAPCAGVVLAIVGLYMLTGRGQIHHLLNKTDNGTSGLYLQQIIELPGMWVRQLSFGIGAVAAIGVFAALLKWRQRCFWLAVWAIVALLPVLLLTDWNAIGYISAYLIETIYASALLAAIVLGSLIRRSMQLPVPRMASVAMTALLIAMLFVGTAGDTLAAGAFSTWTGVNIQADDISHDTGIKAIGWYVRQHVPEKLMILVLHTNKGLEVPVAEYYFARRVLACYDLREDMVAPLVTHMADKVDVIVVRHEHEALLENSDRFERVAVVRDQKHVMRAVYARQPLGLPKIEIRPEAANKQYDQAFAETEIPQGLPVPEHWMETATYYKQIIAELRVSSQN
jgi:hypothetical protein